MDEGTWPDRRTRLLERRLKAAMASLFAGLLVALFLAVSISRDIRALTRDTRSRAAAVDDQRDMKLHQEILGELASLSAELRVQRQALERLHSVTPVQAMRDRAAAGR